MTFTIWAFIHFQTQAICRSSFAQIYNAFYIYTWCIYNLSTRELQTRADKTCIYQRCRCVAISVQQQHHKVVFSSFLVIFIYSLHLISSLSLSVFHLFRYFYHYLFVYFFLLRFAHFLARLHYLELRPASYLFFSIYLVYIRYANVILALPAWLEEFYFRTLPAKASTASTQIYIYIYFHYVYKKVFKTIFLPSSS